MASDKYRPLGTMALEVICPGCDAKVREQAAEIDRLRADIRTAYDELRRIADDPAGLPFLGHDSHPDGYDGPCECDECASDGL